MCRRHRSGRSRIRSGWRSVRTHGGRDGGFRQGGETYFQPADVVPLASYTYENVRVLLLSTSKAYPNGLSNNHGQVGKHYFSHNQGADEIGRAHV